MLRYRGAGGKMAPNDINTGDRLTWRQAIILVIAMVAFIFISRAVYDFFHANVHLRPVESHSPGAK